MHFFDRSSSLLPYSKRSWTYAAAPCNAQVGCFSRASVHDLRVGALMTCGLIDSELTDLLSGQTVCCQLQCEQTFGQHRHLANSPRDSKL